MLSIGGDMPIIQTALLVIPPNVLGDEPGSASAPSAC
jgi:hypothetical protein